MAVGESYTFFAMFDDFHAQDRWSKTDVHCIYKGLVVAIATRHADAVDINFLANGRPVTIALPHRGWEEYQKRTGKVITDSLAIQIAGTTSRLPLRPASTPGKKCTPLPWRRQCSISTQRSKSCWLRRRPNRSHPLLPVLRAQNIVVVIQQRALGRLGDVGERDR